MVKYKLCPVCELNYIREDEDMCELCRHSNEPDYSISDVIAKEEQEKQEKFNYYNQVELPEKEEFISIRYNKQIRRRR